MENILNLKTYNKYKSLIDSGHITTPSKELTDIVDDIIKSNQNKIVCLYIKEI